MADFTVAENDWIKRRADAIRGVYSAFDALVELGVEGLSDEDAPTPLFCPFHTNVNTPAAHYYPRRGGRAGYLHCFAEKSSWDAINIYMKRKNLRFMEAIGELERRFRIKVERRPEGPAIEFKERSSGTTSEEWANVPRVLDVMEKKLLRIRSRCGLTDYVKFCRVIDAVRWDWESTSQSTPTMANALAKLSAMMDNVIIDPVDEISNQNN